METGEGHRTFSSKYVFTWTCKLGILNEMAHETELRHAARTLAAAGASKGEKARAAALSPERRWEIARKAVQARWERMKAKQAAEPPAKPVEREETAADPLDWEKFQKGLGNRAGRRW